MTIKNGEYTRWEKIKHRIIFKILGEEIEDLIKDAHGDGFGEGYQIGFQEAQKNFKQGQIDLYEQGKTDGKRELTGYLRSVNPEQLVRQNQNGLFLGNTLIDDNEAKVLREEVKYLKQTKVWSIITNMLAEEAREKMFTKSESWDDMIAGKMLLFAISIQENILKVFETYKEKTKA